MMFHPTTNSLAIILAGGNGSRAKTPIPKQFITLGGKMILEYSIECFVQSQAFKQIIVIVPVIDEICVMFGEKYANRIDFVQGGETRALSVRNALDSIGQQEFENIFIHDAARPGVNIEIIHQLFEKLAQGYEGALPVLDISDALWAVSGNELLNQIDRSNHFRAQTPQAFDFKKYCLAFKSCANLQSSLDDAQIAREAGLRIGYIAGNTKLDKITKPEDFAKLEFNLNPNIYPIPRIGNGYDAHRFCGGEFITLCGEKISHNLALEGHSDADVAWHALVDAILGALAEGDIGIAFPPSDNQWKGAPSKIFLEYAKQRIIAHNGKIANIDITIICEAPKISPYSHKLKQNTADALGIACDLVNIKATTTEKMGFTGRKEGIAAMASVCILV